MFLRVTCTVSTYVHAILRKISVVPPQIGEIQPIYTSLGYGKIRNKRIEER